MWPCTLPYQQCCIFRLVKGSPVCRTPACFLMKSIWHPAALLLPLLPVHVDPLHSQGQLGNGLTLNLYYPPSADLGAPISTTVVSLSAGYYHTCVALSGGTAYCWGLNANSQLGDGTTTTRLSPVAVLTAAATPLTGVSQIAAGGGHTCTIQTSSSKFVFTEWLKN